MPETNFFWDPLSDNILQERGETGAITAEYTTEPGLCGNLISQNRGGVESQYHFDALGSTLALTDDNQQITDTEAYTALGEVTEHTGSTVNPFQYVGRNEYHRDEATLDTSVRKTFLDVGEGRWQSTARLAVHANLNAYAYLSNNPLVPTTNIMALVLHSSFKQTTAMRQVSDMSDSADDDPSSQVPDKDKCLVAKHCTPFASGFYHCGVYIRFWDQNGNLVTEYLHATGKYDPRTVDYGCHIRVFKPTPSDPPYEIVDLKQYPASACECLKQTMSILNSKIGIRNYHAIPKNSCFNDWLPGDSSTAECNSNYVSKCLLRKCGLNYDRPDRRVPGWEHRMWHCLVKRYNYRKSWCDLCIHCDCYSWYAFDESWCGKPERSPPRTKTICPITMGSYAG